MEFGFNVANTRNPLKLAGVSQTGKPISAANRPKFIYMAQRDGRPAEYRWRRLSNAAKFG